MTKQLSLLLCAVLVSFSAISAKTSNDVKLVYSESDQVTTVFSKSYPNPNEIINGYKLEQCLASNSSSDLATVSIKSNQYTPQDDDSSFHPQAIITGPDNENLYFAVEFIMFHNLETDQTESVYEINPGIPVTTNNPMPEGEYEIICEGAAYDTTTFMPVGLVLISKNAELNKLSPSIDIKYSDIKNKINYTALLPDGTSYPAMDFENMGREDYGTLSVSIITNKLKANLLMEGFASIDLLCNDLPESFEISAMGVYTDREGNNYACIIPGPTQYNQDAECFTDIRKYTEYSTHIYLTEADKNSSKVGIMYGIEKNNGQGLFRNKISEKYSEDIIVSAAIPDTGNSLIGGIRLGSIIGYDQNKHSYITKCTGLIIEDNDTGKVLPGKTINGEYSNWPEIMRVNETADYFSSALSANADFILSLDNSGTIRSTRGKYELTGPHNENFGNIGLDPFSYITGAKLNGEPINVNDVRGLKWESGNSLEIEYRYDNILVDGIYPSSNITTIGFNNNGIDDSSPSLTMYQVRDSEGIVTNKIKLGQGFIYIGVTDLEELPNIKLSVAKAGSNDWLSLKNAKFEENYTNSLGTVLCYDIDGLESTGWYDLKVELTDSYENFMNQTVGYCFCILEVSGLNTNTKEAETKNAIYYDLMGRKVSPNTGIFIQETTTPSGEKRYTKVVK